jgi:protein-disulfide isomerase
MRWGGAIVVVVLMGCSAPLAAPAPTVPPVPTVTPAPAPTIAPAPTLPPPTPTPRAIVQEPRTATGEFFLGRADAPVTFDMFGDFQCPACGEFARTTEPTFIESYVNTGKVKFVWHDYAWIGDESFVAAQAGRCAGRQGQFWAYHNYLYAHQRGENLGQFSTGNLQAFAASIGLDEMAFATCMELLPDMPAIEQAQRQGISQHVDVTPTFMVNGDLKVGAPPMNRLAALLDSYLARTGR